MAVAIAIPGSSGALGPASDGQTYFGFAAAETAGATAHFRVRAGSSTGTILDTIKLIAGESASAWYGPQGILAPGGVYYEKVSGTLEGSLRLG